MMRRPVKLAAMGAGVAVLINLLLLLLIVGSAMAGAGLGEALADVPGVTAPVAWIMDLDAHDWIRGVGFRML
jgi:hypothetical protein